MASAARLLQTGRPSARGPGAAALGRALVLPLHAAEPDPGGDVHPLPDRRLLVHLLPRLVRLHLGARVGGPRQLPRGDRGRVLLGRFPALLPLHGGQPADPPGALAVGGDPAQRRGAAARPGLPHPLLHPGRHHRRHRRHRDDLRLQPLQRPGQQIPAPGRADRPPARLPRRPGQRPLDGGRRLHLEELRDHDDLLAGRPPDDPARALRGGEHRRRRAVAGLPPDHPAAPHPLHDHHHPDHRRADAARLPDRPVDDRGRAVLRLGGDRGLHLPHRLRRGASRASATPPRRRSSSA